MDAALKARWVEALRSGKYRQTRHQLRRRGGAMCCLGVFCDLVDSKGWRGNRHKLDGCDGQTIDYKRAQALYGLYEDFARDLAERNDSGASFSEIADEIEKLL